MNLDVLTKTSLQNESVVGNMLLTYLSGQICQHTEEYFVLTKNHVNWLFFRIRAFKDHYLRSMIRSFFKGEDFSD